MAYVLEKLYTPTTPSGSKAAAETGPPSKISSSYTSSDTTRVPFATASSTTRRTSRSGITAPVGFAGLLRIRSRVLGESFVAISSTSGLNPAAGSPA